MRECEQLGCSTEAHAPLARALAQGLSRHRLLLQNQLRAAEAQLDRARTDWLDRRREHKTLTLLRDKKREDWLREQMASEQRELEELSRPRPASAAPQGGEVGSFMASPHFLHAAIAAAARKPARTRSMTPGSALVEWTA